MRLYSIKGCILGIASICSEPLQCPRSSADGQYYCYSLFESSRENQILRFVSSSDLSLEMVQKGIIVNVRADYAFRNWNDDSDWMLHPEVFTWLQEAFGRCLSSGCSSTMVEPLWASLCISSICSDREVLAEDSVEEGEACSPHSSSLASSTLMLQMLVNYPVLLPKQMDLLRNPHRQRHPLIQNGHLILGVWLVSGISCQAASFQKILSQSTCNASWRNSTAKSYDSAWNLWAGWCK